MSTPDGTACWCDQIEYYKDDEDLGACWDYELSIEIIDGADDVGSGAPREVQRLLRGIATDLTALP